MSKKAKTIKFMLLILAYLGINAAPSIPSGISGLPAFIQEGQNIFAVNQKNEGETSQDSPIYKILASEINRPKLDTPELIILITAESLGVQDNKLLQRKLESSFDNALAISMRAGTENIRIKKLKKYEAMREGGTFGNELLMNCQFNGKYITHIRYHPQKIEKTEKCLAKLAHLKGFETFYFHSGSLNMYNRNIFMPIIGYDHIFSLTDQLKNKPVLLCLTKNFCAPDDKILFDHVIKKMNWSTKKIFINIMTIETHGPYRSLSLFNRNLESEIFYQKARQAHEVISAFTKQIILISGRKRVTIIIASDHPAPLSTSPPANSYLNIGYVITKI